MLVPLNSLRSNSTGTPHPPTILAQNSIGKLAAHKTELASSSPRSKGPLNSFNGCLKVSLIKCRESVCLPFRKLTTTQQLASFMPYPFD